MQELQDIIYRYETANDQLRRLIAIADDQCRPTFLFHLDWHLAILKTSTVSGRGLPKRY
jgi:hypothetical protein